MARKVAPVYLTEGQINYLLRAIQYVPGDTLADEAKRREIVSKLIRGSLAFVELSSAT